MSIRQPMAIVAVTLAAMAAGLALFAWLGGDDDGSTNSAATGVPVSTQPTHGTSREFFRFESLSSMVATSSVVVEGTVAGLEAGRVEGSGHDEERYTNVVIRVHSGLFGDAPAELRLEELASFAGSPIELDGVRASQLGDRGIYFLRRKPSGVYVLVSSQGRMLEDGSRLQGASGHDELVERLSEYDVETLKARISDAKQAIAEGRVKPEPGPPGLSR